MKTFYTILVLIIVLKPNIAFPQPLVDYKEWASEKYANKDYKGAISDYSRAIQLDPNDMDNILMRGLAKEELKDYYGAISDYDKIIDHLKSKNNLDFFTEKVPLQGAYYDKGKVKNILHDYTGAIMSLNKAIELFKDDYHCYSERADAKFELKDYRGAIGDYNKCIQYCMGNEGYTRHAYFKRGLAKIIIGIKEDGCLDLSKAGELGSIDAYEIIKKYCQ